LIEKYIADHGKDPINNEELSTEDLIEIKTSKNSVSIIAK
jgi:pre-mRNA-processing factor 19